MAHFGRQVAEAPKSDNHERGRSGKIKLRRAIVEEMGADQCHVLDCFAGAGVMRKEAWHDVADYSGCDLRWEAGWTHRSFVVNNVRLLRATDLNLFNVFDLDAYGSPWEQVIIIAARRKLAKGEKLALALTDGSAMKARFGTMPHVLAQLAGVEVELRGANRQWTAITGMALKRIAAQMGAMVDKFWQAEPDGRSMLYSACTMIGA